MIQSSFDLDQVDLVTASVDTENHSLQLFKKMSYLSRESSSATASTAYITSTPCLPDGKIVKQSVMTSLADSGFSDVIKPGNRRLSNIDDLRGFSLDSGADKCSNVSIEEVSLLPLESTSNHMYSEAGSGVLSDSGCFSDTSHIDSALSVVKTAEGDTGIAGAERLLRVEIPALPSDIKNSTHCDFIKMLYCIPVPHVLRRILNFLSDDDLLRMMQVSRIWHDAVHTDTQSKQRIDRCKKERIQYKENIAGVRSSASKRAFTPAKQPFDLIQSTSNATSSTLDGSQSAGVGRGRSQHELFWEEASKLLDGEGLRKCPRCQSPARADLSEGRLHCTMQRCDFDYCLRCDRPYHGSTACRKPGSRASEAPAAVGSQRSRKNLRRL